MDYQIHPSSDVHSKNIGKDTIIWQFVVILKDAILGSNVNVNANCFIENDVVVGNRVTIKNGNQLWDGITIEDDVFCGPSCVFTNVINPRSEVVRKDEYRKTIVKKGASIGANATIVCGHNIGEYAFIAAGAVVTKEVPNYALMAGIPAKRIGWMSKSGSILEKNLVCPIDGTKYEEISLNELRILDHE